MREDNKSISPERSYLETETWESKEEVRDGHGKQK
jgi:hypothetical protein